MPSVANRNLYAKNRSNTQAAKKRAQITQSTVTHRANESIRERQASEQARLASRQAQSQISKSELEAKRAQRVQTQEDLNAVRNKQRAYSGAVSVGTRTSIWSTVVMLFFLGLGIIAIYILVKNGEAFGNVASGVGTFISGLSSNSPLFKANQTGGVVMEQKQGIGGNAPAATSTTPTSSTVQMA